MLNFIEHLLFDIPLPRVIWKPVIRRLVTGNARPMGMAIHKDGYYHITEQASYWIHRLQNEYSLNYINRLWGTSRKRSWPQSVRL